MLDRHRVPLLILLYATVREYQLLVIVGQVALVRCVQLLLADGNISLLIVEHLRRDGSLPAELTCSRDHLLLRLLDGVALYVETAGRERTWQQAVLTRSLNLHD